MLSVGECIGLSKVVVSCGRGERVRSESWPTGIEAGRVRDDVAHGMAKRAVLARRSVEAHTIEGNSRDS